MHQLRMKQLQFARAHQQMLIRRGHVDPAGQNDLAVLGLLGAQMQRTGQQLGHHALVPGRQMLHHHNAAGKIRRDGAQRLGKRVQTAGRRANGYNVVPAIGISDAAWGGLIPGLGHSSSLSPIVNRILCAFAALRDPAWRLALADEFYMLGGAS